MKEINEDIKNGTFRPAYLLYGSEIYLRRQYRDMLVQALVPDGDTMNFTRFQGQDTDEKAVISQADTMPFFAERRVILVEDSGFFKNKADKLADYMKKLPDYLVLIFSEQDVDKRSRMYKAVQKAGRVTEFATQPEDVLVRWIFGKIKKEGKQIRNDTMHHFLELTGTDMTNISSELEKLLCYTMKKNVIETSDVDAICAPKLEDRVFEMVRAVAEHRQREALDYYYDLLALKVPPMRVLYLLTRQYNQMLQIKSLASSGMPDREIASAAGVRPFVVGKTLRLARSYTTAQLESILNDFADTEERTKTGVLDGELGVEMLIVKYSGR